MLTLALMLQATMRLCAVMVNSLKQYIQEATGIAAQWYEQERKLLLPWKLKCKG